MTKISQGGVECEIIKTAAKDTALTINLSSIERHAIGPWQIEVSDGKRLYHITVTRPGESEPIQHALSALEGK